MAGKCFMFMGILFGKTVNYTEVHWFRQKNEGNLYVHLAETNSL